jgi:hypothetical protein
LKVSYFAIIILTILGKIYFQLLQDHFLLGEIKIAVLLMSGFPLMITAINILIEFGKKDSKSL